MSSNNNNQDHNKAKNEYQKILQKIQSESKQNKSQRAFNILKGQKSKNQSYQPVNYFQILSTYFTNKKQEALRFIRVKQIKHTAILSVFLVFSTYLCWIIERKYDVLQKKAKRTQTYKQRQVQKENQYIERMLRKKQFESVPIPTQIEAENSYRYSEQPGESFVIDTKQDLIDLIKKDNKHNKRPQDIYEEELRRARERV